MPRQFEVRTNCEYKIVVTVPDGGTEDDAITEAHKTSVTEWDQAWAPAEAEAL